MRQLLAFILCLWVFALPAVAQEDDKSYLTRLLQDTLSDAGRTVQIDGFEGSLSSQATMTQMTIADEDGIWLTLRDVVLNWNRAALLRGRVEVETLTAASLDVPRGPAAVEESAPPAEAAGFSLPDLPVSIDIKQVEIERLTLGPSILGQALDINLQGRALLDGGSGEAEIAATRLDQTDGQFAVSASYEEGTQTISLDLDLSEAEGGLVSHLLNLPTDPSVKLVVQGTGPLDNFAAKLALSTDGQERLAGDITLQGVSDSSTPARAFKADVSGDVTALFAPQYRDFFGEDVALLIEATRSADGALDVSNLNLTTRLAALRGQARLDAESWPTFLAIEGEIEDQSGDPVLLPFGDVETRIAGAEIAIDFDSDQSNQWTGVFDVQQVVRSDATVERLQLLGNGTIDPDADGLGTVIADLDAKVNGLGGLTPELTKAVGTDLSARAQIRYTAEQPLDISGLSLEGQDYTLTGDAVIDTLSSGFSTDVDVALRASDLSRFDDVIGQPLSGETDVSVVGSLAPLAGTFDLTVAGKGTDLAIGQAQADAVLNGITTLDIKATRDETGTRVDILSLSNGQLRLDAQADLRTGASTVSYDFNLFDATLIAPALDGALVARGEALQTGDIWSVDTSADGPFGIKALIKGVATGPTMDLNVNARLPDVARLVPDLDGPFAFDGTVKRVGTDIEIKGDANGADYALVTTALMAMDSPDYDTDLTATLTADNLQRFAKLAGQSLAGAADVTLTGQVQPARQHFDLQVTGATTNLRIGQAQADAILKGTTDLNVKARRDATGITVETLNVANDTILLSADANFQDDAAQVNYDVNLRNTKVLSQSLTGPLNAKGQATMQGGIWSVDTTANGPFGVKAQVTGVATGPDANLAFNARLPDTGVFVPDLRGPLDVDGTLQRRGPDWQIETKAAGVGGTRATISGIVTETGQPDLSLQGSVPLGLASPFIAPRTLQGSAGFDLILKDTFDLAGLSGQITTSGARLSAPNFRIALENLDVTVGLANGRASVNGTANASSGGSMRFAGPVGLTGNRVADLQIALNQLGIVDPTLYRTTVDGTVSITGPLGGGARISGALRIGETDITVPASGFTSIGEIPDITHVGASGPVIRTQSRAGLLDRDSDSSDAAAGPGFPLDIAISAPSRIFVRGRGIDAELGGQLTITGTTTRPISAGRFDLVRGRLDILEKRFDLDEGSIQLQGDLVPFIRFVAVTDTSTGTASVIIEGPADAPTVRFASNPDGPQDEVLSQLLFGRDLSQISALQALQLANAVATLAGRDGVGLIGRLRKGFGLDDLDINTSADGSTEVTAGKYISDNVYTDVTVGSQGDSEVSINIDLTPNITAKGSVGSDGNTGIGLYYQKDY